MRKDRIPCGIDKLALVWLVLVGGLALAGSPVVPEVKKEVQPLIEKHRAEALAITMKELTLGHKYAAFARTPVRIKAIDDPWAALSDLEASGLRIAGEAKKGLPGLPSLLDALIASIGKPAGTAVEVARPKLKSMDDHVAYIITVLDKAKELRDAAFAKIPAKDREFSFAWAPTLMGNFGPQAVVSEKSEPVLRNDRAFVEYLHEDCDWAKLVGSAKVLCRLADADYLAELKNAAKELIPIKDAVPGVTGDILFKKETPHGLILIGGKGDNAYDLKMPVAFLLDIGGNDTYKGMIAASFDIAHPNSVIIDLDGDDTYEGEDLGLATGRFGVGLLVDLAGNDTYKLKPGSGGAALGGIGILCDVAGNDKYHGSRFTQGAAIGGIGLLLDLAGDDEHTSWGLSVGLGGPAGVGAVIDIKGNDSYQCGKKYPSGYNQSDAPKAKPGDPEFQWDSFGLAMGLGRRCLVDGRPKPHRYDLAGGIGMVIDLEGNDRYESSNFSQACGYFFGTGLLLDLAGDDTYAAARYGHASGAHFGLGLFIDYQGKDTYTSTGPTYNCGCAWDRSVFLFIDAGKEADTYDLRRSYGCGQGDIGSWGVFADLGGNDRYLHNSGYGGTSRNGLAVFFDRAGDDEYPARPKDAKEWPENRKTFPKGEGGLFVDR